MAKTIAQLTELAATPDATDELVISDGGVTKKISVTNLTAATLGLTGTKTVFDGANIAFGTTTGTKLGTATTQKIGFWNATPAVQPAAVSNLTVTATTGSLPTADASVTIANAATPTVAELLEYCVELETTLENLLSRLRTIGIIAT